MGKLETDTTETKWRTDMVQRVTKQSVTKLLAEYRRTGYAITDASLVVGSRFDPATIANPHIRAHALEGQLFRWAIEKALNANKIRTAIFLERDAFANAAVELKKSTDDARRTIQNFGRSTDGPGAQSRNLLLSVRGSRFVTSPRWSKSEKDENL